MQQCTACITAESDPKTPHFGNGCFDCASRVLAQTPAYADSVRAGKRTDGYANALRQVFGDDWPRWHLRVKYWYGRLGTC